MITGGVLFDSITGIGQFRLKTDQREIQLCKMKSSLLSTIQQIKMREAKNEKE